MYCFQPTGRQRISPNSVLYALYARLDLTCLHRANLSKDLPASPAVMGARGAILAGLLAIVTCCAALPTPGVGYVNVVSIGWPCTLTQREVSIFYPVPDGRHLWRRESAVQDTPMRACESFFGALCEHINGAPGLASVRRAQLRVPGEKVGVYHKSSERAAEN
jgi:hypothetical protein